MCSSTKSLSQLSAITFIAKSWHNDACSQNGLPLTPNSISILGKFQFLKTMIHPNLVKYLDAGRGKHGKCIVYFKFLAVKFCVSRKNNYRLGVFRIVTSRCQDSFREKVGCNHENIPTLCFWTDLYSRVSLCPS